MVKNTPTQAYELSKFDRSRIKNQTPKCIWLTGISGAGKSAIANALDIEFKKLKRHTYVLDGDNIRNGLCSDLSFSDDDRKENIRRVAEVSGLMVDAGLVVITALISPFQSDRNMARSLFMRGEFFEIFIKRSIDSAKKIDQKGLYQKAADGEIRDFTGVDSDYEIPKNPELVIDTENFSIKESVEAIMKVINEW